MAKHAPPWGQKSQEEKIESLHVQTQRIVKTVNRLYRLIEPMLDTTEQKGAKNEP